MQSLAEMRPPFPAASLRACPDVMGIPESCPPSIVNLVTAPQCAGDGPRRVLPRNPLTSMKWKPPDVGLKHRPADEVRPVPIPPELVAILRWHLGEFGITPDGRLFRQVNGGVVSSSTHGQVWRGARLLALARISGPRRWPPGPMTCATRLCRCG